MQILLYVRLDLFDRDTVDPYSTGWHGHSGWATFLVARIIMSIEDPVEDPGLARLDGGLQSGEMREEAFRRRGSALGAML